MEPITSLDDKRLGFSDASHGYEGILHESLKVAIARAEKAESTYRSQEMALATLRASLSLAEKVVEAAMGLSASHIYQWGSMTNCGCPICAALLAYDAQKEGKDVT